MKTSTRLLELALVGFLSVCLTLGFPSVVSAAEPPLEDQYYVSTVSTPQNPNDNLVLALTIGIARENGDKPPPGVNLKLETYSCGALLRTATATTTSDANGVVTWLSPDGKPTAAPNSVNRRVGPSIEYTLTVQHDGYDSYLRSGSYGGYGVKRPSCAKITAGGGGSTPTPTCSVSKWSVKKPLASTGIGTGALRGSPVAVTATKASCPVTYRWRLNGKQVGKGKKIFVKQSFRGKRLTMRVKVAKPSVTPQFKVVRYGRVR